MKKNPSSLRRYMKYSVGAFLVASVSFVSACSSTNENGEVAQDRECRAERHLGSRIQKRVCMTTEQWAVVDERNARLLEANAQETQDGLRQADIMGSHVQGRAFDSP